MKNEMEKDTKKIRYKVDKTEINFIDMIIKAYEGIGTVNVDHDNPGQIWIDVTEGTEKEVKEVMEDLSEKFYVELIES
jgi:type II secretory pathway component HofQ